MRRGEDFFEIYEKTFPNDMKFTKLLLNPIMEEKAKHEEKEKQEIKKQEEKQEFEKIVEELEEKDVPLIDPDEESKLLKEAFLQA